MKMVITAATEKELSSIKQTIDLLFTSSNTHIKLLLNVSGVGILSSCFSLTKLIYEEKPDLIMQIGIAGAFNNNFKLGKVVTVKEEIPGDTGVEEEGTFKDLFELNLNEENQFPFTNRKLTNPFLKQLNFLQLDEVTGVTINEITTQPARIETLKAKYKAEIESMEGASLHYCCLQTSTPFIQIRAISNYIGERDKEKWNFKESFKNLNETVVKYIQHLNSNPLIIKLKKD